jgi:hypothetical protein
MWVALLLAAAMVVFVALQSLSPFDVPLWR